jgi:hypothetical protein
MANTALLGIDGERRLVWLAPRGLITVLLFLAAAETGSLEAFPFGAVMPVVLVTATALAHRGARAAGGAAAGDMPGTRHVPSRQNEYPSDVTNP